MRIYRLIKRTRVEGPGLRACLWVQGCSHGCRGCYAEHMWNPLGGYETGVSQIIKDLEPVMDEISGITLLGGEPFDQAGPLAELAKHVREKGKNVITFTGYLYEDILARGGKMAELLSYTDLLCDGPYAEELHDDSRPMLGSSNQRYIFLTQALTEEDMMSFKDSYEIRVGSNGRIQVNGKGDLGGLMKCLNSMNGGKDGITII